MLDSMAFDPLDEDAMAQTRKLLPTEGSLLAEHLIRLSAEDRRLRFGGMFLRDDAVRRYVDSIDWAHSWHVGYFDDAPEGGVARFAVERCELPGRATRGAPEVFHVRLPGVHGPILAGRGRGCRGGDDG